MSTIKKIKKILNKLTLPVVFIMFISPIIISWWLVKYTDVAQKIGTANYGELLIPLRTLPDMVLSDPLRPGVSGQLHKKWSLIYLTQVCDDDCQQNIYRMRQVRWAVGKHASRIQRIIIPLSDDINWPQYLQDFPGQWVLNVLEKDKWLDFLQTSSDLDTDDMLAKKRLYLVDPLGNIVLYFPEIIDPKYIIKDLKKLLRASRIG